MKLNKKMIIPAFALLAGASLVGSISGTIAWYQYSTRTNVSYIGTSAGSIGNLQIRLAGGDWGTQISIQDVEDYLLAQSIGQKVEPVTPGALAKDGSLKNAKWDAGVAVDSADAEPDPAAGNEGDYYFDSNANKLYKKGATEWAETDEFDILDAAPATPAVGDKYFNSADKKIYERVLEAKDFYLNPQIGVGPYNDWLKASQDNYVKLPLQLRFMEQNEEHLNAEDVYLSKLVIKEDMHNDDVEDHGDISNAIRVHLSAYKEGDEGNAVNHLISKQGGTMLTHGKLRIGNGADFDKAYVGDEFGFDGSEYTYVNYGGESGVQTAYSAEVDEKQGHYYEEEFAETGWKQIAIGSGDELPVGEEGDFFFKTGDKLYRKGASEWEEFTNLVSGDADPDLDTDRQGKDYYFNTASQELFLNGAIEETVSPIVAGPSDDATKPLKLTKLTNKVIGQTVATRPNDSEPQKYLNVDVTIWVEGWQKFNNGGKFTSLWDRDLIGAMFDVGLQFAVQDR